MVVSDAISSKITPSHSVSNPLLEYVVNQETKLNIESVDLTFTVNDHLASFLA